MKGASPVLPLALREYIPAVEFSKPFGQGQPQSRSLVSAADRSVDLFEGLEDPLQILFFDTDAGVRHRDIHDSVMVYPSTTVGNGQSNNLPIVRGPLRIIRPPLVFFGSVAPPLTQRE